MTIILCSSASLRSAAVSCAASIVVVTDAAVFFGDRSQQRHNLVPIALKQCVERHRTIFASAPGDYYLFLQVPILLFVSNRVARR